MYTGDDIDTITLIPNDDTQQVKSSEHPQWTKEQYKLLHSIDFKKYTCTSSSQLDRLIPPILWDQQIVQNENMSPVGYLAVPHRFYKETLLDIISFLRSKYGKEEFKNRVNISYGDHSGINNTYFYGTKKHAVAERFVHDKISWSTPRYTYKPKTDANIKSFSESNIVTEIREYSYDYTFDIAWVYTLCIADNPNWKPWKNSKRVVCTNATLYIYKPTGTNKYEHIPTVIY